MDEVQVRSLRERIESLQRDPERVREADGAAVDEVLDALDRGALRVATPEGSEWVTHAWIKAAILLYFRRHESVTIGARPVRGADALDLPPSYYDKLPTKRNYEELGARCVP